MSQLLKHYWINRDTGGWATDTPYGLMMPNIEGLEVKYNLFTENNIPYCLSTVPEYFEYEVTVSQEQLTEYQNNSNITIISSTEKQIEVPVFNHPALEPNEEPTVETRIETVYDVVYREIYIIQETEGEGLKILTQQEWDAEIEGFDNRQQEKRYDILREIRDRILEITDWIAIKSLEQESLSTEFKTWRQTLRDLPNSVTFPTEFPTLPTELENHTEIQELYSRFNEVRSIQMINDTLPSLPEPNLPGE
jgi:hypothetical protein